LSEGVRARDVLRSTICKAPHVTNSLSKQRLPFTIEETATATNDQLLMFDETHLAITSEKEERQDMKQHDNVLVEGVSVVWQLVEKQKQLIKAVLKRG
jgi:hypothetical protein